MEKAGQKLKEPPLPGGGAKRRTSMFEKENFAQLLKERIRNSSLDVCGTEPMEEESMAEFGKTELFALKAMTKMRYANTYRMEPNNKFQAHLVRKKIQQILMNRLQEVNYDDATSNFLCTSISDEIIASVKAMGFDRYKYVVIVLTVEKTGQAINIASRWLWDVARDDWVSAKCEMESFVVLALLVACYFE